MTQISALSITAAPTTRSSRTFSEENRNNYQPEPTLGSEECLQAVRDREEDSVPNQPEKCEGRIGVRVDR